MSEREWESFWHKIEAGHGRPALAGAQAGRHGQAQRPFKRTLGQMDAHSLARQSRPRVPNRSLRCGVCQACRARDCGSCKNCRDKPRFGGPGVKKKACIART